MTTDILRLLSAAYFAVIIWLLNNPQLDNIFYTTRLSINPRTVKMRIILVIHSKYEISIKKYRRAAQTALRKHFYLLRQKPLTSTWQFSPKPAVRLQRLFPRLRVPIEACQLVENTFSTSWAIHSTECIAFFFNTNKNNK